LAQQAGISYRELIEKQIVSALKIDVMLSVKMGAVMYFHSSIILIRFNAGCFAVPGVPKIKGGNNPVLHTS